MMTFTDNIGNCWKNVSGNRLRTSITVIIIALGIFALILIITAIQAASNSLTESFSTMGSNAFSIRFKERSVNFGGHRQRAQARKTRLSEKKSSQGKPITYSEAMEFSKRYDFPGAIVSIALRGPFAIVVNNDKRKTNPDINMFGGDENYLALNGYEIAYGRNFTASEIRSGGNYCMIGATVAEKLFPENPGRAVDAVVHANHIPYRVIAVLKEKGSSSFLNADKIVITGFNNIRRLYASSSASYNIGVKLSDLKWMDAATGEAKAVFRPVRKLDVKEADNFYIDKSDSIAEALLKNLGFLESGTIGIAFITLIAAAIGLMNIMLVAVNERTKEIGLAMALGSTRKDILNMFLIESVLISLMGAVVGIISGVLLGNLVAVLLDTGLVIPWGWVGAGIGVCFVVGLAAGYYPAVKASRLDPIVALRYE
jgi:putative ABC transport system permease protein